jgi:hypothetical protein
MLPAKRRPVHESDAIRCERRLVAHDSPTGIAARILAKHPGLTVAQIKVVLRALASNVVPASA